MLSCSDVVIGHNFLSARISLEAERASKRIVDFKVGMSSRPSSMLRLSESTIGPIN
jgi:hypothetical protein